MAGHVLIDGNNLLHAMHAHAPVPNVGRETLVRHVERWAHRGDQRVTLVFDGAGPQGAMARQMASKRIEVVFSAPRIADDVIVEKLKAARQPLTVSVVTDDTAVAYEARRRRATHIGCRAFIDQMFTEDSPPAERAGPEPGTKVQPSGVGDASEKPRIVSREESDEWVELFGKGDDPAADSDGFI